jgi:two-component system response regulator MprA
MSAILVVEDEVALCDVIAEILYDEGYAVFTAGNGRVALDMIAEQQIHLVLMDVTMPIMGGLETMDVMGRGPAGASHRSS